MNEFYDSTINEGFEQIQDMEMCDVTDSIKSTADLSAGEESWLEQLVHRIIDPITDIFETSGDGVDSEVLSPSSDVSEETVKEYEITDAVEEWHVQDGQFSCAVCCQQFIINEFLDLDVSEQELCEIAEQNGWFDPESGTGFADVDNLLELYGIDSKMYETGSIEDIIKTLDEGGRVIAGVDGEVLAVDGVGNYPWSGADHVVEVIGIDDSNPSDVKVIINDSGVENGCGRVVSLSEFQEAWDLSGDFMVSAFPKD